MMESVNTFGRAAGVIAVGGYAPVGILTNADIERMVDTSDEWIRSRSGIATRHIARADEALSDMLEIAAKQALERANFAPEDLDAIIVASVTGDSPLPSTACIIQHRLGAVNAMAFDVAAACTGSLYALVLASSLITAGQCRHVLVLGGELLSKVVDYTDRTLCPLLGDAAGAMLVAPVEAGFGLLTSYLRADGSGAEFVKIPAGGSRLPATCETVLAREHYMRMNGREVFKFAVRAIEDAAKAVFARSGYTAEDIALVVPHQANIRIINSAIERINIPAERWFMNLEDYGNTGAGSIPFALNQAFEEGRLHKG
ncbi:MAG TPA: beta-ketoacyl-ACP synthase III, partial [Armatimonadota bacterium]